MNRKKKTLIASVAAVFTACCLCVPASAQTVHTPQWLASLGNGTTAFSCTSGTCSLSGQQNVTSFTLSAGATLVNPANSPLIVRSTGTCTIAGTISGSPAAGSVGSAGNGDFGGGGGGGGGGTVAGTHGKNTSVDPGIPIVNGGFGGAAGGGAGGNAVSVNVGQYRMLLSSGSSWPGGGAAGSPGGGTGPGLTGGGGGLAGTPVIFICQTIAFTGSINVSGGAGASAPAVNTGAGGGGGGGYVLFAAVAYASNTGTINVSGGPGGTCNGLGGCGAGGTGGSGFTKFFTIQ